MKAGVTNPLNLTGRLRTTRTPSPSLKLSGGSERFSWPCCASAILTTSASHGSVRARSTRGNSSSPCGSCSAQRDLSMWSWKRAAWTLLLVTRSPKHGRGSRMRCPASRTCATPSCTSTNGHGARAWPAEGSSRRWPSPPRRGPRVLGLWLRPQRRNGLPWPLHHPRGHRRPGRQRAVLGDLPGGSRGRPRERSRGAG